MKNLSALTLLALAAASAYSAPLTPGNLLVTRVGEPGQTTNRTNAATKIYVEEYTTGGTLVQSFAIPGDGTGVTQSGSATSEGFIQGYNGFYTFVGYGEVAGVTGVVAGSSSRKIGVMDSNGNITYTSLTDAYLTNNIRAAISDGTNIWTAGTGATPNWGIRSTTVGGSSSLWINDNNTTPATNIRMVTIFNGQLYGMSASTAYNGVFTVGTGLPTVAGQASTLLTGFPDTLGTGTASGYDFAFADANTLYVADDRSKANGGGVVKWTYNGSTWSIAYRLNTGLNAGTTLDQGARALAVTSNGTNNVLYVTSAQLSTGAGKNGIYTLTDTGAASTWSLVKESDDKHAFRGVEVITASAKTVSGTVDLGSSFNGIDQNTSNAFTIPVTFEVTDSNNAVVQTTTVNVTGNGGTSYNYSFTLNSGISGNVTVKADTPTHLVKKSGLLNANSNINTNFSLINGDVDDDDVVSVFDYIALSDAFDLTSQDSGYVLNADLDKDGTISVFDYIVLSDNFDVQGDRSN